MHATFFCASLSSCTARRYIVQTSTCVWFAVCAKVKSFWCLTLFDNANKIPFIFEWVGTRNTLPLQIFRSRKRVNEHNSLKCTTYQNMYNFSLACPPPPHKLNAFLMLLLVLGWTQYFVYKNIDFNWSLIEFVFHLMCRRVHYISFRYVSPNILEIGNSVILAKVNW